MHHPVFGIIFLPRSVIRWNQLHHFLSLPFQNPDLKLTCSTNPSHHRSTGHSTGLPSRTSYHSALCFSSSVISLCSFKRQLKSYLFSQTLTEGVNCQVGPRTTVRRHCDCTANLAPIINRHSLPTYLPIFF